MKKYLTWGFALIAVLLMGGFLWKSQVHKQQTAAYAEVASTLWKVRYEFEMGYSAKGRFPTNNDEANLPKGNTINAGALAGLVVLPDSRVFLQVETPADNGTNLASIYLTPEVNTANRFLWHCRANQLPEELQQGIFGNCLETSESLTIEKALALQEKSIRRKERIKARKIDPALAINLPKPVKQKTPEEPKPCTNTTFTDKVLVHENGIGIWNPETQQLRHFIETPINQPTGFFANIGNVLYLLKGESIWYTDLESPKPELKKSSIWIKPGTSLYSVGNLLLWITPDKKMFVGDACHLPTVKIIHSTTLDLGRRERIIQIQTIDNYLYLLSRYESDWRNSSELNIYRIKDNGTLVHSFHFNFDGLANAIHLDEPFLLVANGRDGLDIFKRTIDYRWLKRQNISALDFAADALIEGNRLWLADRSAGIQIFERKDQTQPWEQVDHLMFDFPIFSLERFNTGFIASSRTQHAWIVDQKPYQALALKPTPLN